MELLEERRKRGENCTRIEKWSKEDPEDRVMIGDFNARTGTPGGREEGEGSKEQTRRSEDKEKDGNGEEMLKNVRNRGMMILNGNIKGDELGKRTFFGPRGDSVRYYIVTNGGGREEVEKLEIVDGTESDRMPLELALN